MMVIVYLVKMNVDYTTDTTFFYCSSQFAVKILSAFCIENKKKGKKCVSNQLRVSVGVDKILN